MQQDQEKGLSTRTKMLLFTLTSFIALLFMGPWLNEKYIGLILFDYAVWLLIGNAYIFIQSRRKEMKQ